MRMEYYCKNSDNARQLMDLPIDTLVDILLRLPVKSLGCIQCVSKTLLKMVNHISFSTLHTRLLIATNSAADQVPRLMCCSLSCLSESKEPDVLVTLESLKYNVDKTLTKGRYAIALSSSTEGPSYYFSFVFYNLFFLGSNIGDCILINPLGEREVLRLSSSSSVQPTKSCGPNSQGFFRNAFFGMGFDNKTNTYKILRVSEKFDGHKCTTVHVVVLGTNSWREIPSLPPCELMNNIYIEEACANGDMHWLTRKGCNDGTSYIIISFDFKREEFYWTPTPPTLQSSNMNMNMHLLTLRGSLAIVDTTCCSSPAAGMIMNIQIWVLKDYDKKQWVRHYNINNKMVEYSIHREFYDTCGEWEHGIFFTKFKLFNTYALFLDLRYGSINRVIYPYDQKEYRMDIRSYSESLISLKNYGNLEDAHQVIA